jgi:hypothetical protein
MRSAQLPHALQPHLLVVAESGGALVRSDYAESNSAWFSPQVKELEQKIDDFVQNYNRKQ